MKRLFRLSFVAAICGVAVFSCKKEKEKEKEVTLVSIAVTTQPTNKIYTVGDTFNPAGMVVTARYSDNTNKPVPLADLIIEADFTTSGTKTVKFSFTHKGVTRTVDISGITVNPPTPPEVTLSSIEVTGEPKKKVYELNEPFDPDGITVKAKYSDNSTKEIPLTDPELKFDADFSSAGTDKIVKVKFTYKGVTKEFEIKGITVNELVPVLQSIEVSGQATQYIYGISEPFNPAGLTVIATYNIGDPKTIPNDAADLVWTLDNATASAATNTRDKSVTVKYKDAPEKAVSEKYIVRTLEWRIAAVPTGGTETTTIYLYADETVSNSTNPGNNKIIIFVGVDTERKIKLAGGRIFSLQQCSLTLGNKVTLDGSNITNNNAPLVELNSNAVFTMKEGSKITGNNNTSIGSFPGGAVYIAYGTFIMEGGIITGNKSSEKGGGVSVCPNGTFIMSGGSITGNQTDESGGGVYVYYAGTFDMRGGTINGNTAKISGNDVFVSTFSNISVGKLSVSGYAEIGNLALQAYQGLINANVTLTGAFTGKIDKLDLAGGKDSWANVHTFGFNQCTLTTQTSYTPVPVITAGESYALTQADIRKFTLGDFVSNSGGKSPITQATAEAVEGEGNYNITAGFYLYGTNNGETEAANMGKLWMAPLPPPPTQSNCASN